MKAILNVWPWVRPHRRLLFASLFGTTFSVIINLTIPILTSRVIDDGIAPGNGALVRNTALIMVLLILLGMAVRAATTLIAVRMSFNTITDMRRDLYNHVQDLSFANLDRSSSGELLTRLTSDMTKVSTVLSVGSSFISQTPIMFVGAFIAILNIDSSLALIVLTMVPVIALMVWYVVARSGRLYDLVQARLDRLNTVLQENIDGTEAIKSFVRQDQQIEIFDEVADDLANQATLVNQLVAALMPSLLVVASLGVAAVVWLGGNRVIDSNLSDGELVAFISYMAMLAAPIIIFAFVQPLLSAAGVSMTRIEQVLDQRPDVVDNPSAVDLSSLAKAGAIGFHGVSFAYRSDVEGEDLEDAICDVSFEVKQGQTVAILGATGSGKSTLIHLIPRFYDVTAGAVTLGGVDVRSISTESLRRGVGIALQEPQLFSGTIAENLKFGNPDASDEQMVEAARAAQAHDFITEMVNGYQSPVDQGGANLSGGQRQRISIARTLLTNPRVLILDDSTSAVDLETEARIQSALSPNKAQTVVLVAQRISTALGADEIMVLDEGRVCAKGTHEELIETSSIYQEIYKSQLGEAIL